MEAPKFSVVVVGRNEEKTLPRLLRSLEEFFKRGGEMVLVDTGSKDQTAKVARDAGCKVVEVGDRFRYVVDEQTAQSINRKFVVPPDHDIIHGNDSFFAFDQARNFAMEQSSNDFICTPDCDEAFTTLNIDKINELITQGYEKFLIEFVFAHHPDGSPAVAFCADTRFYDRRKIKWKGIIHETMRGEAKMIRLTKNVVLLEHYQNKETDRTKYLAGLAWACAVEPDNDRNSHYFARELMYRGLYHSAIKEFQRHIDMDKWPDERGQSMVYMGTCYDALGETDKALEWWHKAFELTGNRREPLLCLAHYWKRKDKPAVVAAYAAAALQIPNNGFYANRVSNYTFEPHALMYWAKGWLGDIQAARQHLTKCLEYHPTETTFIRDMQFYFSKEEILEAKRRAGIIGDTPKVSILMPARNVEKFIGKAIQSCIDQTFDDWELIVVDDGSTDSTLNVMAQYSDKDKRVRMFHIENRGYPAAFNECLSHARGKYIARMDADDWDHPTRLERSIARLESTPVCDCVSCSMLVGEEGSMNQIQNDRVGMIPEKYMDFNWYARGGSPVNPAIVAKREIYDMVGGFKLDNQCGMDSEWDVRANLAGARWAYIDEPLYYYRQHPNQTVRGRSFEWYRDQQKSFLDGAAPLWNSQFNPRRHIEVMVTGKCNKKCQHCSQATFNKLHRDYDYSMPMIEKLCKRSIENGARYEWLQFSGGEPLLWDNLEEACKYAKESGAFKKVRIMSNCFDKERMSRLLDEHLVDMVYTDTFNSDPEGLELLKARYRDRSTMADIPHKPLPTEPVEGTLPARCTCDRPSVIGNNVYPCGNFFEHVTRLGKNLDDYRQYFCTLDDDWIGFYRKVDRFNMDVCKYCLSNWWVWEKIPYPEQPCA